MILALWLLLAPSASADAISGPPEDCPPGSRGTSSHAGAWCVPETAPAECPDGERREPVGLCVITEERPCGGRPQYEGEKCTFIAREVTSSCETQADCAKGTCDMADRCVRPGWCGCQSAPGPGSAVIFGTILLGMLGARQVSRRR